MATDQAVLGPLERVLMLTGNRHGLKVEWFSTWNSKLESALAELPQEEFYSHDLFRRLVRNPSAAAKLTGLITDQARVVAIVGLIRRQHHWEPVGSGGLGLSFVMPIRKGYEYRVLASLGLNIRILEEKEPPRDWVQDAVSWPFYRMALSEDFERYWRTSGNMKSVRSARNRTKGLSFHVDSPGATTWTIREWARRWQDHPSHETYCVEDLLVGTAYYSSIGQLRTFSLHDGSSIAAAATHYVRENELLFVCTTYDNRYKHLSVGSSLLDLTFRWAASAGYAAINLGAGHEYKASWAPEAGRWWSFSVAPFPIRALRRLGKIRNLAHPFRLLRKH